MAEAGGPGKVTVSFKCEIMRSQVDTGEETRPSMCHTP